jgi:hypothetical protein
MENEEQALAVLRGIWDAQRRSGADVGPSTTKVCKNMKDIGFGNMAGETPVGVSTAGPVDDDQRAAWRARLEREGKIVRDLILGPDGA